MLDSQTNDAWNVSLGRTLFIASQFLLAAFLFVSLAAADGLVASLDDPAPQQLDSSPGVSGVFSAGAAAACHQRLGRHGLLLHRAAVGLPLAIDRVAGVPAGRFYAGFGFALADGACIAGWRFKRLRRGLAEPSPAAGSDRSPDDRSGKSRFANAPAAAQPGGHGLAVGLCLVWIDVLPALRLFDQVTLWTDANSSVSLANLLEACLVA